METFESMRSEWLEYILSERMRIQRLKSENPPNLREIFISEYKLNYNTFEYTGFFGWILTFKQVDKLANSGYQAAKSIFDGWF